jgi:hypothetical protein
VLVDLNAKAERERLSKSALKGFFKLAPPGRCATRMRANCSAACPRPASTTGRKNPDRVLEVDRITRISYLLGIYKALHILYGDKLADEWVTSQQQPDLQRPHAAGLHAGRRPAGHADGAPPARRAPRRPVSEADSAPDQPAPVRHLPPDPVPLRRPAEDSVLAPLADATPPARPVRPR